MAVKSLSEMTKYERMTNSLKGKTFRAIVTYCLILSIAAITIGFFLFSSSIRREFRTRTWQMSRTASHMLDVEQVMDMAEKVMLTYYTMPEEERAQLSDKHSPLLDKFNDVYDETFDDICVLLREIQENNNGQAAFIAFLDQETNRRVFILDSDPKDTFCPSGSMDEMRPKVISDLINGTQYFMDDLFGVKPMSSTIINMKPYGYRCMAGTVLGRIDNIPVYVFFDMDMNQEVRVCRIFLLIWIGIMAAITFAVATQALKHMNKTTVEPINKLSETAQQFIDDRRDGNIDEIHFGNLNIQTGDEIENLSNLMTEMESDLKLYMENLTRITAERERISTELTLANRIQSSMLPNIFPPFPERKEVDLYGIMKPAREVGGDFYDFYLIDPDHLCLVMADVSGKGVPAALFMMISKIIIQSFAMGGYSPADILNRTNDMICSNNQEEMFVTVWVGILELSTGKLVAANAGHEYPIMKNPDGRFEMIKDRHGLVIGAMHGMRYHEYEMTMEPKSCLMLYTDGAPEATSSENELFGLDRLLDALNSSDDITAEHVLNRVQDAINDFVKDVQQFDDLTMLCLHYKGKEQ